MKLSCALSFIALSILVALPSSAVDGVLEINQACAAGPGCFPGDTAGYPVTITSATGSSVRLTGDLVPDDLAISIQTDDVSVDLNGFAIRRGTAPDALIDASGTEGAVVRNGTIEGSVRLGPTRSVLSDVDLNWFSIYVEAGTVLRCVVEATLLTVQASEAVRDSKLTSSLDTLIVGVIQAGSGATVSGNVLNYEDGDGILCTSCIVEGNTLSFKDGNGIGETGAGSIVRRNSLKAGEPGFAIQVGDRGLVSENAVETSNCGVAIGAGAGSMVQGNSASTPGCNAMSLNATAGYLNNNLTNGVAGAALSGGIDLGGNICNGSTTCP